MARAYNHSILFMLGMPYLLAGVGGGLIYRSYRAAARKAVAARPDPDSPPA